MKKNLSKHIDLLINRYPNLELCRQSILDSFELLKHSFSGGGKLLIAGNGGSCSDAEHIAGELMKSFILPRPCPDEFVEAMRKIDLNRGDYLANRLQCGLPTIVLSNHQSLNTAFANDVINGGELFFAQQVFVYAKEGDIFLGISTSGNSRNILDAALVAKAVGARVISLTGQNGGELSKKADVAIKAPAIETYMVQELHLPIYHCLCLMLEEWFFAYE